MSDISVLQRDLLTRLLALQARQEKALVAGDMPTVSALSETRLLLIQEASFQTALQQAWAPELSGMVRELRQRTADLERALISRRENVRHQMARLTEGRRAAEYLEPPLRKRTHGWTA